MRQGGRILILIFLLSGFFCYQIARAEVKVNINTANLESLETLVGIGEVKARAIISYRELNGDFQKIEDIILVSGIGEITFENIKDFIIIKDKDDDTENENNNEKLCGDNIINNNEECDDGNNISGDGCDANCVLENSSILNDDVDEELGEPEYSLGDIVINEFVSDPEDREGEWIELYNNKDEKIDLNGWNIKEGSNAKTSLQGEINKYFIINNPQGNLNNKGDIIKLYFHNKLIDKVSYGNLKGEEFGLKAAQDPFSLARKIDGYNTFNNKHDFSLTKIKTKNLPNIIKGNEDVNEISDEEKLNYDYSNKIIISELLVNPVGIDNEKEFIEICNLDQRKINLEGWAISDETERKYFINNLIIYPSKCLAFYRKQTKIALNNSGDTVKLYEPLKDKYFKIIKYKKAKEGWTYSNTDCVLESKKYQQKWVWTEKNTPGEFNEIKELNHPPLVDFSFSENIKVGMPVYFDSSDTVDVDGDDLKFFWDFGDGIKNTLVNPIHTFLSSGVYEVSLEVDDGQARKKKVKTINIESDIIVLSSNLDISSSSYEKIKINEILPNPLGDDAEGEWIELFNENNFSVNLRDWKVDDEFDAGSKTFVINKDFYIDAEEYLVIRRAESKIALNNNRDYVNIYNPDNNLVDSVFYEKTYKGESYARGKNDKWFWTKIPSPGKENIISLAKSSSLDDIDKISPKINLKPASEKEDKYKFINLRDIKLCKAGERVIATGTVVVLPGTLSSQYFYITSGSFGIQIYNYKKDFLKFELGDVLEIKGEISETNGEKRIKTKTSEDIKFIRKSKEVFPREKKIADLNDDLTGNLISLKGEVVERKGSNLFLDDGSDEIKVYIKNTSGIVTENIDEGSEINISGILSKTKTGLRLLPRSPDDIIYRDIESYKKDNLKIIGEISPDNIWELERRNKKIEFLQYLLVIAGTLILILFILYFKKK